MSLTVTGAAILNGNTDKVVFICTKISTYIGSLGITNAVKMSLLVANIIDDVINRIRTSNN